MALTSKDFLESVHWLFVKYAADLICMHLYVCSYFLFLSESYSEYFFTPTNRYWFTFFISIFPIPFVSLSIVLMKGIRNDEQLQV